jgi:hypothetical protein
MGKDKTDTSPEGEAEQPLPPEAAAFVPTEDLPDDVRDGDAGEGQDVEPEDE